MPLAFYNHESHIAVRSLDLSQKIDHIPPHVYRLHFGENGLDLVKERPKFDTPAKTYGEHARNRDAIFGEFKRTEGTLGVMLTGMRGAGKSLLGEDLSNRCISADLPVLLVTEPIPAAALKAVIEIIGACAVYFDEYGKVYDKNERERMLTLFSDTSLKKVLFIVTGNEFDEMSKYMYSRPGRFRYHIHFGSLKTDVVHEMGEEHKLSQPMLEYMNAYVATRTVSFDILNVLMPLAAKAQSPDEFDKLLEVLNVPSPVRRNFVIESVMLDGQPFYGEVILERMANGEGFTFKLVKEENLEVIEGEAILDMVEKTLLQSKDTSQLYLLKMGNIVMKVVATWAEKAVGTETKEFKSEAKKQKS